MELNSSADDVTKKIILQVGAIKEVGNVVVWRGWWELRETIKERDIDYKSHINIKVKFRG